jgi:ATP-dependent Lon protease
MTQMGVPADLQAAIRAAADLRGTQNGEPTPESVPVLPLRNAVVFPGALIPLDISRPSSMRAIEVAMQSQPPLVGVFAQRAMETEQPTRDELHQTGSLCIVRILRRPSDGPMPGPSEGRSPNILAWVMLEGLRFVSLESLDQVDPYYRARIADTSDEPADAQQVDALAGQLREMAHRFVDTMPANREQIHAVIDKATEARQLADLVMAHFPIPVADMASYAQETQLSRRLDRAIAILGDALTKVQPPPG